LDLEFGFVDLVIAALDAFTADLLELSLLLGDLSKGDVGDSGSVLVEEGEDRGVVPIVELIFLPFQVIDDPGLDSLINSASRDHFTVLEARVVGLTFHGFLSFVEKVVILKVSTINRNLFISSEGAGDHLWLSKGALH